MKTSLTQYDYIPDVNIEFDIFYTVSPVGNKELLSTTKFSLLISSCKALKRGTMLLS